MGGLWSLRRRDRGALFYALWFVVGALDWGGGL